MRLAFGMVIASLVLPSAAWAQASEAQQRAACTGDAMTFCGAYIPDRAAVGQCLMANRARISPGCRAVMGGGATEQKPRTRRTRRTREN